MTNYACECEHCEHFEDERTTRDNHAHEYGAHFCESELVTFATHFGTFRICRDCASGCWRDLGTIV